MANNFYEGSDASLFTRLMAFTDKVKAMPTMLGLTAAQATALETLATAGLAAYALTQDSATRTSGNIADKNAKRAELRKMIGRYAAIMRATSTVTDQILIDLGLHVPKHRSIIGPPTTTPKLDNVGTSGRTVTVGIHDTVSGRGKGRGAVGAWFYSYVGESYPTDPLAWTFMGQGTRDRFDVSFPPETPGGAQVWVTAAWVNRKGETGPVAQPITTFLQVGGVAAKKPPMTIAA